MRCSLVSGISHGDDLKCHGRDGQQPLSRRRFSPCRQHNGHPAGRELRGCSTVTVAWSPSPEPRLRDRESRRQRHGAECQGRFDALGRVAVTWKVVLPPCVTEIGPIGASRVIGTALAVAIEESVLSPDSSSQVRRDLGVLRLAIDLVAVRRIGAVVGSPKTRSLVAPRRSGPPAPGLRRSRRPLRARRPHPAPRPR